MSKFDHAKIVPITNPGFFLRRSLCGCCFRSHANPHLLTIARTSRNFLSKRRIVCFILGGYNSFSRGWLSFVFQPERNLANHDTNWIQTRSSDDSMHLFLHFLFFIVLLCSIVKRLICTVSGFHRLNIVCPVTRSEMSLSM